MYFASKTSLETISSSLLYAGAPINGSRFESSPASDMKEPIPAGHGPAPRFHHIHTLQKNYLLILNVAQRDRLRQPCRRVFCRNKLLADVTFISDFDQRA